MRLEDAKFSSALQFFQKADSGMWMIRGKFRGHNHWLAYDAWHRTIFEGENHVLATISAGDLVGESATGRSPIADILAHLELSDLSG